MKAFNRALDRFCYKHPRFGISNLMLFIVILSAAAYIISEMDRTYTFLSLMLFSPAHILRGEVWRLVSFLFIPGYDGIIWTAVGLYFYYFIGSTLEREWGPGRFTVYYISGVIFYIIFGFVFYFITGFAPYLDARYLNFSMFFAFAMLYPETRVLLFFFIPIKIKWLAWITAALFVFWTAQGSLLPVIAVLNFLLFFGDSIIRRISSGRRASASASDFRRKVRTAKYESSHQNYTHKCAVCGKTDTQYPELEFRYCSRCAGYRCFCIEHINSHVHFTEEG